jgi:hypothetical protein
MRIRMVARKLGASSWVGRMMARYTAALVRNYVAFAGRNPAFQVRSTSEYSLLLESAYDLKTLCGLLIKGPKKEDVRDPTNLKMRTLYFGPSFRSKALAKERGRIRIAIRYSWFSPQRQSELPHFSCSFGGSLALANNPSIPFKAVGAYVQHQKPTVETNPLFSGPPDGGKQPQDQLKRPRTCWL